MPQEEEAIEVDTADSETMPPESTQPAPDEPVPDQEEAEPEMAMDSEDTAEDGDTDSLLDIFREEENEINSIFSHGIDDISIDSLLDEASQVISEINTKRYRK